MIVIISEIIYLKLVYFIIKFKLDQCNESLINTPASNDCSSYYRCIENKIKILNCPKNFKFDSKFKLCKHESKVDCKTKELELINLNSTQDLENHGWLFNKI